MKVKILLFAIVIAFASCTKDAIVEPQTQLLIQGDSFHVQIWMLGIDTVIDVKKSGKFEYYDQYEMSAVITPITGSVDAQLYNLDGLCNERYGMTPQPNTHYNLACP